MLFLPLENKVHISAPLCYILYICDRWLEENMKSMISEMK